MSLSRRRPEDPSKIESAIGWLTANYQVPIVGALMAFMLWGRLRSWQNFVVDGKVLFSGNDPWYHFRSVMYTVEHWPATMPFDPWTYFPHGTASGQFGTLFDQIVATAALIVGLGSPSHHTVAMTLLFAPAFFGAAAAIPTYFIGRRLGGRIGGITAVTILAVTVGAFFARSTVGFSDHHVAEALFQPLGVLGVMVAVSVATREKPIYEQLVERDFDSLRPTLVWSALAGLAITTYLWVWPFGVLLVGIVGVFLILQMCIEVLRGESPEHTAFAGAVTLSVTGITVLTAFQTSTITASDYSFLQPLLAFGVAFGCVFMAWLARVWEERDLDRTLYPVTIAGILVAGALVAYFVLPHQFNYIVSNLQRIFGLGLYTSGNAATVGEITPLVQWKYQGLGHGIDQLFDVYKFSMFIALLGAVAIVGREILDDHVPAEELLIVVWLVFLTFATFTQVRFQYYLIFPIAVLTGYAVSVALNWLDLPETFEDLEAYQALSIVAIVLVVLGLHVTPALAAGKGVGPGLGIKGWNDGLEWMEENTPVEGSYGGSEATLEYYGTYPRVDDFNYNEGAYGVLSWWDYGHWITVLGERIPVANPFQQGATAAANFLIAPNESQAADVLENINEENAEVRYVAIDWMMANVNSITYFFGNKIRTQGKFFAPVEFYSVSNVSSSDYYETLYYATQGGLGSFTYHKQAYYETMLARLYMYHGSAVSPKPVVLDWGRRRIQGGVIPTVQVRIFENMSAARSYVQNDSTSQIGGIGALPSEPVSALQHYRLVGASKMDATASSTYMISQLSTALGTGLRVTVVDSRTACSSPATFSLGNGKYYCIPGEVWDLVHRTSPRWVKFFERVPGATITGTAPANTTVTATVVMGMPNSNETFIYRQHAKTGDDGTFTMVVPYSTTGYDEWGVKKGYTNVSVRAESSYRFYATTVGENGTTYKWTATADVTEAQVIGEDPTPVTVDLERSVLNSSTGRGNNATATPDGTSENGTATDESGSNPANGTNTSETQTSPSLTAARAVRV